MLCFNFFFLPPVGHADHRRPAELGRAVRVSRRQPRGEQPVVGGARADRRSAGPARRGGAAVRSQPRRPAADRQRRGDRAAGQPHRPPLRRWTTSAICLPQGGDWDVAEAGSLMLTLDREPARGWRMAVESDAAHRTVDAGRPRRSAGAAAFRREGGRRCWPRRAARRGRDARRARRRRRDCHRARAVSRRAQGGGAVAAERGAEVGAAGLARARSADAAHGDSRGGDAICRPRGRTTRSGGSRARWC